MKTFFLGETEFEFPAVSGKPVLEVVRGLNACADYADAIKAERAWFHSHPSDRTRNPCGCQAAVAAIDEFHFRCCECGAEWNEAWKEDL
jgi:hypothetical protein